MMQRDRAATLSAAGLAEMRPNSVSAVPRQRNGRYRIALPEPSHSYDQDAEWFVLKEGDKWREIRFHDYSAIYDVPGLYEQLFYQTLRCDSPRFMAELLGAELTRARVRAADLRVFDLGAGNGIMAEELRGLGVDFVVGADILPAAAEAARRDRPGVYREYHVLDMLNLTGAQRDMLGGFRFNTLTCIAALGFGDIPPGCFRTAYNLLDEGGWVALTIKEGFLAETDTSGFATMIRELLRDGTFEMIDSRGYQHRLATNGDPLTYVGIIGRKRADLP